MLDLDDLKELLICKRCKCVYMPDFLEGSPYNRENYPRNGQFCLRCEEDAKHKKSDVGA